MLPPLLAQNDPPLTAIPPPSTTVLGRLVVDLPYLAPLLVLLGMASVMWLAGRFLDRIGRERWLVIPAGLGFGLAAVPVFVWRLPPETIRIPLLTGPPNNLGIAPTAGLLTADPFGILALLLLATAGVATVLMVWTSRDEHPLGKHRFGSALALLFGTTAGLLLLVQSTHLVVTAIAVELAWASGVGLTDSRPGKAWPWRSLTAGMVGTAGILLGLAFLHGTTDSLYYATFSQLEPGTRVPIVAAVLIAAGFTLKLGQILWYWWSPNAVARLPLPVSGFHATASLLGVSLAGIRLLTAVGLPRDLGTHALLDEVPWATLLGGAAILTMTAGTLGALAQTRVKPLLGWVVVAQAGFVLAGVAGGVAMYPFTLAPERVWTSVLAYLPVMLFTHLGLFGIAMLRIEQTGSDTIDEAFRGLARTAPLLTTATGIALLSLVGLPPTAGFIGKFLLLQPGVGAAMETGPTTGNGVFLAILTAAALLNTVAAVGYGFRFARAMVTTAEPEHAGAMPRIGILGWVLTAFTVGPILLLGIAASVLWHTAQAGAHGLF